MSTARSHTDQQVADLLKTAKRSLRLSVAFLTRFRGDEQHLELVESSVPFLFQEGYVQRTDRTLCHAALTGELPAVMPNLKDFSAAMRLPAARMPRIRSFVTVPVTLSDGTVYGTFCAAGLTADKQLTRRDQALMDVLAQAAAVIVEPGYRAEQLQEVVQGQLAPVLAAGGPLVALQPIVDLTNGQRVGAEALARFPAEWAKAPDVVFAEAHGVGSGHELELLALRRAADHLQIVDGYIAMNVSPATLLTDPCRRLLDHLPLNRVVLELSEHDQVADYPALNAALAPYRARGMRLAIDDVGAGFSSLRHIVITAPDVIKLDRSIVTGLATDQVLSTLVGSLVTFAHGCGTSVVAEGVETVDDLIALRALGADYGQGWHLGRPGPPHALVPAQHTARSITLPAAV